MSRRTSTQEGAPQGAPVLREAWRAHFSRNAADLLAVVRWADGLTPEEFAPLLLVCFKRSRAGRISETTVLGVLQDREDLKAELRRAADAGGAR